MTLHREQGITRLGLWDRDRSEILDLARCPQMSEPLAAWFAAFRSIIPPIQFGNVRLRVAPDGTRGIWLDFPNKTIDALIKEAQWLSALAETAVVEVGQRRLPLEVEGGSVRLGEKPKPRPWFETYIGERAVPLYCTVGSFTQPGYRANHVLVDLVRDWVEPLPAARWLELGAGIGNFSLPLAAAGKQVTALEMDPLALAMLARSASECGLAAQITAWRGNMHTQAAVPAALISDHDAVFADPPRSGLRGFPQFLGATPRAERPRYFLYLSCFAESLTVDVAALGKLGYRPQRVVGIDQFPQSKHAEWLVLLQRD
ncbi:hypothetical protein [Acanthopleuribacter pedis]|uniref:Methyltransferase domain-containing protein n=1 Tax=Acanthopleuribacter pedis TaxID=442870 RepID=A0A8J7U768_9BACT|nr:hypothetical protein [Acanthopleuribacter pedis]MBO1321096.1 hypothetical protein [Acanthopleuribacter pedis]